MSVRGDSSRWIERIEEVCVCEGRQRWLERNEEVCL